MVRMVEMVPSGEGAGYQPQGAEVEGGLSP